MGSGVGKSLGRRDIVSRAGLRARHLRLGLLRQVEDIVKSGKRR